MNLTGGRTRDGGDIVGASVFYSQPPTPAQARAGAGEDEISKLDAEIKESETLQAEAAEAEQLLSSLVWICTSTHSISKVTVIDANNPADVLESFHVCSSHLLCISSVPGAKEDDYTVDEELNKVIVEESSREPNSPASKRPEEAGEESVKNSIGSISFVSCATGEEAIQHQQEEGRRRSCPSIASLQHEFYFSFYLFLFYFISRGTNPPDKRNSHRSWYVFILVLFEACTQFFVIVGFETNTS